MQIVGLVSALAMFAVGTAVGLRLLVLARRTRGIPELAIGFGLLCSTSLGYPFAALGRLPALLGTAFGNACFAFGVALSLTGIACFYLLTWRVFRADAPWARGVVGAAALALLALGIGIVDASSRAGPLETVLGHTRPWACGIVALLMAAFAWNGAESLHYHGMLRRRLALGLADPVVANRFLLWALSALAVVAAGAGILAGLVAGRTVLLDPGTLLTLAAACLTASAGWFLAFVPPRGYLRLLRRRAAVVWGLDPARVDPER